MTANMNPERARGNGDERHPAARHGLNHQPVNWLLLIPLLGTLLPFLYNSDSPRLGGMPFFYWYQMLWIPISVAITWVVFTATRKER